MRSCSASPSSEIIPRATWSRSPWRRRWRAWLALGLTSLLLAGGAWFNFVAARVPDTPTVLRVGERPPDFTLSDAAGRDVSLSEYRGKKPVVIVFYRGYW